MILRSRRQNSSIIALLWCRYERGNRFAKHVDDSVKVGARESRYTLLIYLSGSQRLKGGASGEPSKTAANLKGGETLFYGQSYILLGRQGEK